MFTNTYYSALRPGFHIFFNDDGNIYGTFCRARTSNSNNPNGLPTYGSCPNRRTDLQLSLIQMGLSQIEKNPHRVFPARNTGTKGNIEQEMEQMKTPPGKEQELHSI
ncbi:hypothetical protein TNIN_81231 [Trichonephila inaurata madagascariensis]|uniref:Uncharacterized protein n=1 Tax=Trichonephila inaurata madagascariensis TaxID=2747483 RepID=A0A8X6XZK3_9ARAC|nr:hypothetical protein TNIN_81231 [Trichonephila inaurata madagascariensis]